jgi:filamentous hemagglutinin family protein
MASKTASTELIWQRRSRASLMRSTALQAAALAVLATPAAAQLAPNARPTGGAVSAGQASISTTSAKTLITQSSENAAINWQSYNVGAAQTVQYKQPNASSVTLNRVVGANPSQIAGHILANGQIVLVNQSGVVFSKGAQVDTAGLVVSTAGITDKNFMNGKLVFDQGGHLGASISNAGNITIRQAGLAALVAPQVANSGTITARLGRVILGAAETHTLDLYGDGLVALNVTGQVTKASVRGQQVTALVTNSGTILAPGGTVVLSASAVDGVVTNLVEAGGKIAAPSVGAQGGRVLVQGIGGGISIDADVSARGLAAGTKGGQVVANATGQVRVGPAATIDASGDAGGGVIAVGTTAARAIGGASVTPTLVAQSVSLAAGSHLRANATRRGTGGHIAVLSQHATTQSGDISARGGAQGGDGGWIEVSGGKVGFGGLLDAGAPAGKVGSVLIDPANLVLGADGTDRTTTYIDEVTFALLSLNSNVILKADGNLTVAGPVTSALGSATLKFLQLEGDTGIAINDALTIPGVKLGLYAPGGAISEGPNGVITAGALSAQAGGAITLGASTNKISDIAYFNTGAAASPAGSVTTLNADGNATTRAPTTADEITITGLNATGSIQLNDSSSLTVDSPTTTVNGTTTITTPGGAILSSGNVSVTVSGSATTVHGNTLAITPDTLSVGDDVTAQNVTLATTGTVAGTFTGNAFSQTAGTILAQGMSATPPVAGNVSIKTAMGALSIGGAIITEIPASRTVPGGIAGATTLTAAIGNITEVTGTDLAPEGAISTGTLTGSANTSGTGNLPGNANFAIANGNTISTLTGFVTSGSFALEDDTKLTVTSLTSGGAISVTDSGSSAAGADAILVIDGAILSTGSSITLVNERGIAELTNASVGSVSAGVTLSSADGGILQQTLSALTSRTTAEAGINLSSKGATDFGTALGTAALGTVTGISLGGSITAGALSGTGYTGSASITATDGDIVEVAGGGIHVGTLFGTVSDLGTTTTRSISLSVSSGNTISFIDALTATGSIALEDDVALSVGALTAGTSISVAGPGAPVTADGILTLNGPITADGAISLQNKVGIAALSTASVNSISAGVSLVSGGGIFIQKGASIAGAQSTGNAVSLDAGGSTVFTGSIAGTVHGIAINGVLTAGSTSDAGTFTGTLSLTAAAGDITEGAEASLNASALSGSANAAGGSTGSATLNASSSGSAAFGNTISALGSFSTAGSFALLDQTGLTVNALAAGGGIAITGTSVAGDYLALAGSITAHGTALFSGFPGIVELQGAGLTDASGAVSLVSGGAIVQQAGSSLTAGALSLQAKATSDFNTTPNLGTVSGILFNGNIKAQSASFSSEVGNIAEGAMATLLCGTVAADAAGGLSLAPGFGNEIGSLSGMARAGSVVVEDDSALSIGNLSAAASLAVREPSASGTQTGSLTVTGIVTATDNISLANKLGISEASGGTISGAAGTVTLSTAGAISQLASSKISGGTISGTGTLVVLNAGTGITFDGAIAAGTLSGTVPTGVVRLITTAGDIVENADGSIGAQTLAGGAAAGSASFTATAGNEIGTLISFPVAGNFALEDDAGLLVRGQTTTGGSIHIYGPSGTNTPGGFLVLDGNISAPGNITLSNTLGVADLAGVDIHSTSGGVSLVSSGGAILEQAGATIESGATPAGIDAILMQAGGHTVFGTTQLATNLGTVHGIDIEGTVTAGILNAAGTGYNGSTSLSAGNGDITEGPQAIIDTGSLAAVATGGGVQGTEPVGNVSVAGAGTNLISALGSTSADGNILVVDAGGLTLGALHANGTISVRDPAAGANGILIIGGPVSAGGSIDMANALGIAELGTGSVASAGGAVSLVSRDGAIVQLAGGTIAGGSSGGTGTLVSLSVGGTTVFANYGVSVPNDPVAGISFGGIIASGQVSNGLYSGTANFAVAGGNIAEAGTGSLRAGSLIGSVTGTGNVSFTTQAAPGNVVSTLSALGVGGSFSLEDDSGLIVKGLSAGGSIALQGPSVGTPTGLLVLDAAITATNAVTLDNGFGIADLADITSAQAGVAISTLNGAFVQRTGVTIAAGGSQGISIAADGGSDFTNSPAADFGTVSGIAFNGTLKASNGIATLNAADGDIVEGSDASLQAAMLNGSTSGNAKLDFAPGSNTGSSSTGSNLIAAIGTFHSGGDTTLQDSAGLSIGTLTADGNVDIHGPLTGPSAGMLALTGTLSAAGGIVSLQNDRGISLGGTLTAGSLSGQIYTGLARLSVTDGDIVETSGGSVRTGTLAGSGRNAAFGSGGNVVSTLNGFTTSGDFSLADTAGLTLGTLTASGSIAVSGPGSAAPAGFFQVAGPVSGAAGVTLTNALGIVELAGASVQSSAGSIAFAASGGGILQQNTASLTAATGLTLHAGGFSTFGTLLTGQSSAVVDGIAFAGRLSAGGAATFTADEGNIVEQSTGVVRAGALSASASTTLASIAGSILLASVSSPTTGNQVGTLAGARAAAGFGFVDGQALTVTGAVQAGGATAANLQIVAPAIDVTAGSLQLLAPAGSAPGVIDLVADHFVFATPGAVSTPGGLVALDLLNAGGNGTSFAVGGATISGDSLSNIQSSRGTLSIGQALDASGTLSSTPNTGTGSWTLGAVGTVTAIDFAAPVNFGNASSPAALGLFSDDVINVSNGITVASLYGSAGSATAATGTASILGSNVIGTLGVLNDAGELVGFLTQRAGASGAALQFQLADTSPLLVLGPVSAPQGAVAISVTGTQNGAANALTIGSTATSLSGQIAGTDIALAAAGNIVQATGTLEAVGAAAGTNGTIAIASSGGAVTLDGVVEGASAGSLNAQSALLLNAGGGDITEGAAAQLSTGTLAASASGSISLGGAANNFAIVGSLTSIADGVTLYGLAAGGAGGIVLNNANGLRIADDTVSGDTTHPTVTASDGPVDISLAAGGLFVGLTTGAMIEAVGPISLTAPGFITQTGGVIASQNAGVTLDTLGTVSQSAGTLAAMGGDVQVTAPVGFSQSGGAIFASGNVEITSTAGAFLQDASIISGTLGVMLDIAGSVISDPSTIVSGAGMVAIASHTGGITLSTVTGGDVLLSAGGGDITQAVDGAVNAGTLAAAASGNIDLSSVSNHILNIGSLSSQSLSLTLAGLAAGGTTGIALTDDTSLNILADTGSPVVQANSAGATLSIDVVQAAISSQGTSYGSLTIGSFGASTLQANAAMTLQATGSVTQTASALMAGGNLSVTAVNGDIDETGGSLIESAQDAGLTAGGAFNQSASVLSGAHGVGVNAGGDLTSVGSTIQSAGITGDATSGTIALSTGGSMTLESLASAGTLGAVHLSALSDIVQVSADGSLVGTIIAPSLAASAGGQLSLTGPNQVAAITAAAPLAGLAAGNGNLDFVDTVNLVLAPGASVTALAGTIGVAVNGATAPRLVSNGATVHALGDVTLSAAGSLTQAGGLFQSDQGRIDIDANGFTQTAGAVMLANVAIQIDAGAGGMALSGTLQAGAPTNGIYGGAIGLTAGGAILAPTATLLTGTLAAAATNRGAIDLSGAGNQIAQIGTVGTLSGLSGSTITVQDAQSLLVAAAVYGFGGTTFTIPAADFTEAPGALIFGNLTVQAGGDILIGGTIGSGSTYDLSAGGALTEAAGADITGDLASARLAAGSALTIDGTLIVGNSLSLSAGTDFDEGPNALIEVQPEGASTAPATLTAPGTITLDGLLGVVGSLTVIGGAVIEDSTGIVTALDTNITATSGAVTLNGLLAADGSLGLVALTDISIGQTGTVTAGATTITAVMDDATIAGALSVNGALAVTAGGNLTVAPAGIVTADATTLTASGGTATIGGAVTANGTFALTAAGDVTLSQGGIVAAGATNISAGGVTTIDGNLTANGPFSVSSATDFNLGQGAVIDAADTNIMAATGNATIDGQLAINGSLVLTAGNTFMLGEQGTIAAADFTTIAATRGAATIDGVVTTGPLTLTAGQAITLDPTGIVTAASAMFAAGTAVTIGGLLDLSGTLDLTAGTDFTLAQGGSISAVTPSLTAITGDATIDGTLSAIGPLNLLVAGNVVEGATGSIGGDGVNITATNGNVQIAGLVESAYGFTITAGTDLTELQGASITGDPGASPQQGGTHYEIFRSQKTLGGTLVAGGTITVGGALSDPAALTLAAGNAVTVDATGSIAGGITNIIAALGAVTIEGPVIAAGALTINAGTNLETENLVSSDGTIVLSAKGDLGIFGETASADLDATAGNELVIGSAGTVIAGIANVSAGNDVQIDGHMTTYGSLSVLAGTSMTDNGIITSGGSTSLVAMIGPFGVVGPITSAGSLSLDSGGVLTISGDITASNGLSAVAGTDLAADADMRIGGVALFSAGGDVSFLQNVFAPVTAGATTIVAGGAVTIDNALAASGSLLVTAATNIGEGAGASLSGAPITLIAKTGGINIGGDLNSSGAFTIDAHTNISQGADSTIANTLINTHGLSSSIAAPGTITLAGTLSAPSLLIGDFLAGSPVTKSILWDNTVVRTGSNAAIHGATSSISIAAPLIAGQGALGVYTQSASFQQTGTAYVSGITGAGSAATLQVGIEGRGDAKFASLIAPDAQLLLVLEQGGSASGTLDVAGLNVFYTDGTLPSAPVVLQGDVGGRGGFAAAAVGFSHHLPNVNYQINGCPIESINCILLSPLLVPIVDPVNDYAEGTQRKRHQDDEALPNVGEEDY